jgi:hypothetical protein
VSSQGKILRYFDKNMLIVLLGKVLELTNSSKGYKLQLRFFAPKPQRNSLMDEESGSIW